MCNTCLYIKRNIKLSKLTEDKIYDAFNDLASKGKTIKLGLIDKNSLHLTTKYICKECGNNWIFTCPDHSFKGELKRLKIV